MKNNFLKVLFIAIIGISSLKAQSLRLIDERGINLNNWDFPKVSFHYWDTEGKLFLSINESSQPRNEELVNYNFQTEEWEDISNHSFIIPGGMSQSSGMGFNDGSCVVISRTFASGNPHYLWRVDENGNFELQEDALPFTDGGWVEMTMLPSGEIVRADYSLSITLSIGNGTDWELLPDLQSGLSFRKIKLVSDSNGNVYCLTEPSVFNDFKNAKLLKLAPNAEAWETIFTSEFSIKDINLKIFDDEVYFSFVSTPPTANAYHEVYKVINDVNGENAQKLGDVSFYEPTEGQGGVSHSDVLKTTSGKLYFAGDGKDILEYNDATNEWTPIENDIADQGPLSGFWPTLIEGPDGKIYNIFYENRGITFIEYTPENLQTIDLEKTNISIYPNPVKSFLTITNPNNLALDVLITDVTGRTLLKQKLQGQIDLQSLSNGVYFISVLEKGNVIKKQKLIKTH